MPLCTKIYKNPRNYGDIVCIYIYILGDTGLRSSTVAPANKPRRCYPTKAVKLLFGATGGPSKLPDYGLPRLKEFLSVTTPQRVNILPLVPETIRVEFLEPEPLNGRYMDTSGP